MHYMASVVMSLGCGAHAKVMLLSNYVVVGNYFVFQHL